MQAFNGTGLLKLFCLKVVEVDFTFPEYYLLHNENY